MDAWKRSSAQERVALIERLLGKASAPARTGIVKCLDEASNVPGHADLRIVDIVEACKSAGTSAEPV